MGDDAALTEERFHVTEGRARLALPTPPRDANERGPHAKPQGPSDAGPSGVFYNPAMALNRDLSSLLVGTRAQEGWHVLDGLAASGVRGIRYALESDARLQVESNDWNPISVKLIEENAALNELDITVTCRNLATLLHESVWHVVDVDPYGSPAPFLDGATRAVRDGGLLGITATDTTALAGVFPNVCRRRYLATPLHGELGHEVALRILAASAVRQAAKYDIALTPVIAHATDHYYRVMLASRRGAARADAALQKVGVVLLCPTCGERGFSDAELCPACGAPVRSAGPAWSGPLQDAATLDAMLARAEAFPFADAGSLPLLRALREEAAAPPLFFDIHELGSRAGTGSPPTSGVLDALASRGFTAAPVHFNKLGVRTNAPAKELLAITRDLAP